MKRDTEALRADLTEIYEDSSGDVSDLRHKAVARLKAFLDEGRVALKAQFLSETDGLKMARAFSSLTDEVITALWDFTLTHVYRARNPTEGERLALLAVGGYGRGELAPYSDIDLLFLRVWKEGSHIESVIEFVLYSLWDLGFKVGHASRALDETLKLARADHTIMTAMLEFRYLAGDTKLAEQLKVRIDHELLKGPLHEFITHKLSEREMRHAKGGDARFVVEPHVKEGKGGLRDLNSMLWVAKALSGDSGSKSLDRPIDWGPLDPWLTDNERRAFERAFAFLWRIRIHLHEINRRGEDRLSFDTQPEIARRMGFISHSGDPAVERFMRRYFTVTREVGGLTRIFCTKLDQAQKRPLAILGQWLQSGRNLITRPVIPGFTIQDNRLGLATPDLFAKDPLAIFALFTQADRLGHDIHPDAFTAVTRNLGQVTTAFRRDPEAAKRFLEILVQGKSPYRTLSLMTETGFLGRYIPEFGHIVGQTQFNMYHAYTVDEHTLRAIGIIRDIELGKHKADHPLASQLIKQLADKETLYLAMLMHDTGKGSDEGQEIGGEATSRRAAKRLGLATWQVEQSGWLVRHHLGLSDFAQKRDVSDPDTVAAFAKIVETPERLRLLLILTVADIRAVGPGVWNGWKGQLMRDLWSATEALFRGGRNPDDTEQIRLEREDKASRRRLALLEASSVRPKTKVPTVDKDALKLWLDSVDAAYLNHFEDSAVVQHAILSERVSLKAAAIDIQIDPKRNATAITVAAHDRPGLFADLAAALAALGVNVVGATIHTSKRDIALDVFHVQDATGLPYGARDDKSFAQVAKALETAATQGGTTTPAPRPLSARHAVFAIAPTVVFDEAGRMNVVEVSGRDRIGLLADLAKSFDDLGINLASAHIDCYGERAVDAFYVQTSDGLLSDAQKEALKARLIEALDPFTMQTSAKPTVRAKASTAR